MIPKAVADIMDILSGQGFTYAQTARTAWQIYDTVILPALKEAAGN